MPAKIRPLLRSYTIRKRGPKVLMTSSDRIRTINKIIGKKILKVAYSKDFEFVPLPLP
jgi:hypothetical protein